MTEMAPVDPRLKVNGIDIILPTHGRLDLTIKCLSALYLNTKVPFHLVVVDDSTPDLDNGTDLTPEYFERFIKKHDNITFIHSDVPYKCGNQFFNEALDKCEHDYVATVMNSMTVEPEWELVALNLMENDPKIGIIGFKSLFTFPSTKAGLIESAGIGFRGHIPIDIGRDLPGHALSNVITCPAVQWAFALLRKKAVVGNLSENTFFGFRGYDDIDNCFVIRHTLVDKDDPSQGTWKVVYCGLGVGYHDSRATRGEDSERSLKENRANAIAFCKRWGLWESYKKANNIVDTPKKRRKK